jgi:hypothetical protein
MKDPVRSSAILYHMRESSRLHVRAAIPSPKYHVTHTPGVSVDSRDGVGSVQKNYHLQRGIFKFGTWGDSKLQTAAGPVVTNL